jgi:hypothetical protein
MGSKSYDPVQINEEITLEHKLAINEQLIHFTKLKEGAAATEDYTTAQRYKEIISKLKLQLDVINNHTLKIS